MTSLPLQLWPGASGEMYLCYSGVFSLTQAQHGNSGEWEGKRLCGILSRDKTFRATGVQRPAEKSVRERSTRGPRLSLKEPLLGGGAQEEGGTLEQSPDFIEQNKNCLQLCSPRQSI